MAPGGKRHRPRSNGLATSKLLVIKISEDFEFEAKLIDRKLLGRSKGKLAKVKWSQHETFEEKDPEATLLPEGGR